MDTPFHRIIGFGFYDGLTSGVAECQACKTAYRFDMVDAEGVTDASAEVRVFALASFPPGVFERIADACPQQWAPDWERSNVWALRWEFESTALEEAANARIDELLNQARPAEWIIAWTAWADRVLAARRLAAEDLPYLRVVEWSGDPCRLRDWIAFLGIGGRGSE